MELNKKAPYLISYASSVGGARLGSAEGPLILQQSSYANALKNDGIDLHWHAVIKSPPGAGASKSQLVREQCEALAKSIYHVARDKKFFIVLGGDHSSAIGTWSGVAEALGAEKQFGLIWIDAHLDSHTPQTSHTGNIHGMPLASLLGQGDPAFTQIRLPQAKLRPENVCLIGARSFEPEEEKLLKDLQVKIFYMDEVERRGLKAVFKEAIKIVTHHTAGFGLSLDIDSIDPTEAPGTGVMEPGGLSASDLCSVLTTLAADARLIGAEIVEFDPHLDKDKITEKLIFQLMRAITIGESKDKT